MSDAPRSALNTLALLAAVALAGAGGAGLVLWVQGRKAPVPPPPLVAPATPLSPPEPEAVPAGVSAAPPPSVEAVVAKALPAVVVVETPVSRGSAFFVDDARLLTNHHVVAGQSYVKLRLADGTLLNAGIAATAPDHDLAVLRLMREGSGPLPARPALALGTIREVQPGQAVLAIGTPLGVLQNTVTRGIVSSLRQLDQVLLLQTDTALNPGNSGGPLLAADGRVVGINTLGFRGAEGLAFAVAVDHARALLEGRPLTLDFAPPAPGRGMAGLFPQARATESDQVREAGTRRYQAQLAAVARAADQLEGSFTRFLGYGWDGRVTGRFDRSFYALWEPGALQGQPVKGLERTFQDLREAADLLRARLREAEDQARQADVYPGTRRDLRRQHRLEHRGWD